jgi:hypothetical protein
MRMEHEQCNHYCTSRDGRYLRSVAINNKWRVCSQDEQDFTKWNFLDDIEYETWSESFENYI